MQYQFLILRTGAYCGTWRMRVCVAVVNARSKAVLWGIVECKAPSPCGAGGASRDRQTGRVSGGDWSHSTCIYPYVRTIQRPGHSYLPSESIALLLLQRKPRSRRCKTPQPPTPSPRHRSASPGRTTAFRAPQTVSVFSLRPYACVEPLPVAIRALSVGGHFRDFLCLKQRCVNISTTVRPFRTKRRRRSDVPCETPRPQEGVPTSTFAKISGGRLVKRKSTHLHSRAKR